MDRKAEQGAPAGAFTPGPWHVAQPPGDQDPRLLIVAAYSDVEASFYPASVTDGLNGKWIAEVRPYKRSELRPNADLMAASPDLFSVLKALLEDMEDRYDSVYPATAWMGPHIVKARAALAKADGTAK